jgi:hypothetical protein|tara:strand:+ start:151 stop:426 length:276 start_codon:yes stop_codon:yes gene_type:complete
MKDWEEKLRNTRTLTYEQTREAWEEILLLRAGVNNKEPPTLEAIGRALTKYAPDIAKDLAKRFRKDEKKIKNAPNAILLGLLERKENNWWR